MITKIFEVSSSTYVEKILIIINEDMTVDIKLISY